MQDNPKPTAMHEAADPPVRPLWITAGGIVVGCVLSLTAMVWMFNALKQSLSHADQIAAGREVLPSITDSRAKFPEPRLQVAPEVDLAALRAREDAELNSYGWVDKSAGIVRIPIEKAMELTVQRGLPVQGQPGAPQPTRTSLDLQQARPLERETLNPIRTK